MTWHPIATAPKDRPIIVRGWDAGEVGWRRHLDEVQWNPERQRWCSTYNHGDTADHLTDWLCEAPVQEHGKENDG